MVPIPATLFSLQACTYSLIWGRGVPYNQLTEEEKNSGLVYRWFCMIYRIYRYLLRVDSCGTTPLSGTSLKDNVEEKFSLWVELQAVHQINSA